MWSCAPADFCKQYFCDLFSIGIICNVCKHILVMCCINCNTWNYRYNIVSYKRGNRWRKPYVTVIIDHSLTPM